MKPSFLRLETPFPAGMMEQPTVEALLGAMRMAEHAGAKAFAINFAALGPDGWSREAMRRIFSFTPRPCMPYTYRGYHLSGAPDEKRAELQLQAAEEGAAGSDLMGDLFDPSPRELTLKPEAIRRQMRLIDELHQRGSEVLLSSHMNEALSAEEIVEHLHRMEDRGADIAKIVTLADTEEQFLEALRATVLAKRTLKVPFVQLCNGRFARLQRYVGPVLGSMLTFTVPVYDENHLGNQPLTEAASRTLHELLWHRG